MATYDAEEFGRDVGGTLAEIPGSVGRRLASGALQAARFATAPGRAMAGAVDTASRFGRGAVSGLSGDDTSEAQVSIGRVKYAQPETVNVGAIQAQLPRVGVIREPAPRATTQMRAVEYNPDTAAPRSRYAVGGGDQGAPFSFVDQLNRMRDNDLFPVTTRGPYRGLSGQRFEDDTPIASGTGAGTEPPDMSSIPALAAWGVRTRMARQDKKAQEERQGALALEGRRESSALRQLREREAGELTRAEMREAGETERAKLGERGAMARATAGREPTEESTARAALLRGQLEDIQEKQMLMRAMTDKSLTDEDRATAEKRYAMKFGSKERQDRESEEVARLVSTGVMTEKEGRIRLGLPTEGMANGGVVRGFANGGAITEPVTQTQQVNPAIAQYGQYLTAAAQSGVSPVPFNQYMNLLQSTRSAMQTTPSQFADGGDVSALGRPLEGPGTGRSDSIPAVIDGGQPAALSDGEFVIPAHVVRAKGTEFFEKLLAQYAEGAKDNG